MSRGDNSCEPSSGKHSPDLSSEFLRECSLHLTLSFPKSSHCNTECANDNEQLTHWSESVIAPPNHEGVRYICTFLILLGSALDANTDTIGKVVPVLN
jgi:hypothetical protein